jgi:hypothetical protein
MRKHLLTFPATIAIIFLCMTSCKKDKTPDAPAPKTKTDLITTGTWKFSSATISGIDASGYLQACQKDNVYTFVAAGTGSIDEGATKCSGTDPQSSAFTWNFASSESILHISTTLFGATTNDLTLVSLSETQLVVSENYPPYGTIVVTFSH